MNPIGISACGNDDTGERLGSRAARDPGIAGPEKGMRGHAGGALMAALCAVALFTGCQGGGPFNSKPAPAEPQQIEAGSTLTLQAPLAFGPDAALYFQGNQLVGAGELARDLPYCRLSPASAAVPRVLEPATFGVMRVNYDTREVGSSGQVIAVTRIAIASDAAQPYTLSCQWPEGGPSRSFLTTDEIVGAIGAHFSMTLQR